MSGTEWPGFLTGLHLSARLSCPGTDSQAYYQPRWKIWDPLSRNIYNHTVDRALLKWYDKLRFVHLREVSYLNTT